MAQQRVDPGTGTTTGTASAGTTTTSSGGTAGWTVDFFNTGAPSGFEAWGLPRDVAARAQQMLAKGYSVDEILAYVRGTPWYAQTYPGIQQGISLGLISNESDYRSYLNQSNQLFHRYYGRDISSEEMAGFLTSGVSLGAINEQLTVGATYKTMFGMPIDPGSLATILGSGISPDSYLQITAAYHQMFGRDPTSDEIGLFLRSGASPSVLQSYNEVFKQYTGKPLDASALSGLLASGTSPQTIEQEFQTKGDVTQLYQEYGKSVPANTVADILAHRTSLDTIGKQLQGGAYIGAYTPDIQQAMGGYGEGKLNADSLKTLGEQKAGYTTPMGYKLQRALDQAIQRMQGVFKGSLATTAGLGVGRQGLAAPSSSSPPDVGQ